MNKGKVGGDGNKGRPAGVPLAGDLQDRRTCLRTLGLGLGAAVAAACEPAPHLLHETKAGRGDSGGSAVDGGRVTGSGSSPLSASDRPPNILLVIADQERYSGLPGRDLRLMVRGFGTSSSLPGRALLSQNGYHSVEFTSAFCPAPLCSPSRASLLTGLAPGSRPGSTGLIFNIDPDNSGTPSLSPDLPNIASVLKSAGYTTAYFGKWHLSQANWLDPLSLSRFGFDHTATVNAWCANPAFKTRTDEIECAAGLDTGSTTDRQIVSAAVDFIKSQEGGRPWFVAVSVNGPHDICYNEALGKASAKHMGFLNGSGGGRCLPSCFITVDPTRVLSLPSNLKDCGCKPFWQDTSRPPIDMSVNVWRHYLAEYAALIEQMDLELVRLYALARESGALIAYVSDHGDMAGSHWLPWKGRSLYEEEWHVPLILSHPLLRPSTRCDDLVSTLDLAPTLTALAGAPWPTPVSGLDLGPYLLGSQSSSGHVTVFATTGYGFGQNRYQLHEACSVTGLRSRSRKWVRYDRKRRHKATGKITEHFVDFEIYDLEHDIGELHNRARPLQSVSKEDRAVLDKIASLVPV